MTTSIDDLDDFDEYINHPDSIDVFDMSLPSQQRIDILNELKTSFHNEYINKLIGMFYAASTTTISSFIIDVITESNIDPTLKIECCKSLCIKNPIDSNYELLDNIISNYDNIPIPCKILAIIFLCKCENMYDCSINHFKYIIDDNHIECEFKYKMIHSLDNVYKLNKDTYIYDLLYYFSNHNKMFITYKIISCQNLLQNFKDLLIENEKYISIQKILYDFASDNDLDHNRRADACDVLLGLGDENFQHLSRQIIQILGNEKFTIFNNQQNIHNNVIDKSTEPILQTLFSKKLNHNIHFELIKQNILNPIQEQILSLTNQLDKLNITFNRIELDNSLYGCVNTSLKNLLVRLQNYIHNHKHEDELNKRLIEELIDASGKCTTGYGTRLVNVLSGYDDLSIQISDEDNIKGKVHGRLNKLINEIDDEEKKEVIMYEMTKNTDSEMIDRQNFMEFFRNNIMGIKNEIRGGIEEIDEDEFELYFRNAVSTYEGISIN